MAAKLKLKATKTPVSIGAASPMWSASGTRTSSTRSAFAPSGKLHDPFVHERVSACTQSQDHPAA